MPRLASLSAYRRPLLATVTVLGLALSGILWFLADRADENRINSSFRRRAEAQFRFAQQQFHLYGEMVHGLRNFVLGQQYITRDEFALVADDLLQRYPAIQALQWVPRVGADARAAFEAAAARELGRPFTIKEHDAHGTFVPAPARPEYLPILYTEPTAPNEIVFGYDIATAPTARSLQRARTTRELVATQQFRLAQATSDADELGLVLVMPVFSSPADGQSDHFLGFVQCVFHVETMLRQTHRERVDEALHLYYTDLEAGPGEPALLYVNAAGREPLRSGRREDLGPGSAQPGDFREIIQVGGRHWQLLIRRDAAWARAQRSLAPLLLLAGALSLTALAALLLNILLQRTARIEHEVAERTAELETARRLLEDDVRQREETERRLRESEARLQAVIENNPNSIFVKDTQGRYLLFNQPYATSIGRTPEEIFGRCDDELFPPEEARSYRESDATALSQGVPLRFEHVDTLAGHKRTTIVQKFPLRDARGQIYAIGGIVTDITERVRAEHERREFERRLTASQKLESLGVLAGGIAHDFNNILTAILGNASLARQSVGTGRDLAVFLGQIEDAARRAAELCQQMLAYAGRGRVVAETVDVGDLIRGTVSLLEVSVGKSVRLELQLAEDLPPVRADVTQLRQIIMNLVLNAGDAINQAAVGGRGQIIVSTGVREMTSAELARAINSPVLPGGRYVALAVADNGCGMSPETLARIFEPFFTTKFSGRGLGLSAVLGIVQSHRGALFVESRPGNGSTFRLLLPATTGAAGGAAAPAERGPIKLRGTLLIVDDEPGVLDIARATLESHGATVLTATSGEDAVARCRADGSGLGLILLDLTMPGLSGEETIRRLRFTGCRVPVILMSGYSESEFGGRAAELGVAGFIQKPFELERLLATVQPFLS